MEEQVDVGAMRPRLRPSCDEPGTGLAFRPVRIVRTAQLLDESGAGVTVQSICNDDLSVALSSIIDKIADALGGACLARPLNPRTDGSVNCDVLTVLPPEVTCDTVPGASQRTDEAGAPITEDGRAVCVITQQVPDGITIPTDPGWYYDDFTMDVQNNCPEDRRQRIAFTAEPPSGAEVRLECFQSVGMGGGEGGASIGDFCDPATGGNCAMGSSGDGDGDGEGDALSCDPVARSCGVPCSNDSDCRGAGLIGFVCDERPLSTVSPEQFMGDDTPYNFCVNPTCG